MHVTSFTNKTIQFNISKERLREPSIFTHQGHISINNHQPGALVPDAANRVEQQGGRQLLGGQARLHGVDLSLPEKKNKGYLSYILFIHIVHTLCSYILSIHFLHTFCPNILFIVHMGQFLQGGKNGRLMSFFFLK